ncbi:hypothetical protein WSM22_47360 [Cytophagales bacterium WSM2-2]|nr:hypothetical protein WSM22_47360 [Cytophagales bacterium WSM2-2]
MKQINWFDRKFDFSSNQNTMPSLIERLEGTPIRLIEKMKHISPSLYKIQPGGNWSMFEHIGHLADLETLWQERLDDILNGNTELRPADLANRKTTEANHNSKSLERLLDDFSSLRIITLERLKNLKDEDVFKSALHPRLKTPMRTLDHFTFVAEHDDHHLAKITELINYRP